MWIHHRRRCCVVAPIALPLAVLDLQRSMPSAPSRYCAVFQRCCIRCTAGYRSVRLSDRNADHHLMEQDWSMCGCAIGSREDDQNRCPIRPTLSSHR